ncbi:MAG: hypothetical protein ABJA78_00210 [Ferruginibacter sp.]
MKLSFRFLALAAATLISNIASAQEKVEVNGHDVGSWFKDHWIWVAAGVLLLLLIIISAGGSSSSRRKKTTIVRDDYGKVKSVTTTEVEDI